MRSQVRRRISTALQQSGAFRRTSSDAKGNGHGTLLETLQPTAAPKVAGRGRSSQLAEDLGLKLDPAKEAKKLAKAMPQVAQTMPGKRNETRDLVSETRSSIRVIQGDRSAGQYNFERLSGPQREKPPPPITHLGSGEASKKLPPETADMLQMQQKQPKMQQERQQGQRDRTQVRQKRPKVQQDPPHKQQEQSQVQQDPVRHQQVQQNRTQVQQDSAHKQQDLQEIQKERLRVEKERQEIQKERLRVEKERQELQQVQQNRTQVPQDSAHKQQDLQEIQKERLRVEKERQELQQERLRLEEERLRVQQERQQVQQDRTQVQQGHHLSEPRSQKKVQRRDDDRSTSVEKVALLDISQSSLINVLYRIKSNLHSHKRKSRFQKQPFQEQQTQRSHRKQGQALLERFIPKRSFP